MGRLYVNGQGVAPDYEQAQQWFEKAAVHGSEYAKTQLPKLNKS